MAKDGNQLRQRLVINVSPRRLNNARNGGGLSFRNVQGSVGTWPQARKRHL